ncbi:universal stress protein [Streptomyces rochei]|uniref:universal stress protein n=1 Tax=Streptomyces rochei TaxID=1928 RepID=UPI00368F5488
MSSFLTVGVDGSASSLDAVAGAARDAEVRNLHLRVVHALPLPARLPLDAALPRPVMNHFRKTADSVVQEAENRARTEAAAVRVSAVVLRGEPLSVLLTQPRSAAAVVVGHRGLNPFTELILGSTTTGPAAHAEYPVVVVRGTTAPTRPVVLGVDGSPAGAAAVRFAFGWASAHGAHITALHAWTAWNAPLPSPGPSEPYAFAPGMLAAQENRLLAEALAGTRVRYPDVKVEHRNIHGPTRPTLIEASRNARLTVVGSRGRGGFAGLSLDSVSQALLQHAHSPVAVVQGMKSPRQSARHDRRPS